MSDVVKQVIDTFSGAREQIQQGMARILRGMPIEHAAQVLEVAEKAIPQATKALQEAVRSMRAMPMSEMLALLDGGAPAKKTRVEPKKRSISAARKRALAVQGRYLGMLRRFPDGRVRSMIKAIAKKKGTAAAIREMESIRRSTKGKH